MPAAAFGLALAGSFSYHSRAEEGAAPPAEGAAAAEPVSGAQRIAFTLRGDAQGDSYLYTVALDGSGLERLTHPPAEEAAVNDGFAAWSPDGTEIAIVRQVIEDPANPEDPNIYTIAPDGSGLRQLTKGPGLRPSAGLVGGRSPRRLQSRHR